MDAKILELDASKRDDAKQHQEALDKLAQRLNAAAMENESLQAAMQARNLVSIPVSFFPSLEFQPTLFPLGDPEP